jgi:hypothetical protein
MSFLVPYSRDEQEHLATLDIEDTMEDPFGMMLPGHRHTDLFSSPPIAVIERWGFP